MRIFRSVRSSVGRLGPRSRWSRNNGRPSRSIRTPSGQPHKVLRIDSEKRSDSAAPISGRLIRSRGLMPHSAKTYEFSGRGACAEKRMSFRCLSRRHLSVVFRRRRKRLRFRDERRTNKFSAVGLQNEQTHFAVAHTSAAQMSGNSICSPGVVGAGLLPNAKHPIPLTLPIV